MATTSSSPATSDGTARPRAVTPGTVTAGLLVPLLIVAGVAASLHTQEIGYDWADRQIAACRHLPFPMTEYAAAWTGLGLGLAAVAVCAARTAAPRAVRRSARGDLAGPSRRYHRVVQRSGGPAGTDPAVRRLLGRRGGINLGDGC